MKLLLSATTTLLLLSMGALTATATPTHGIGVDSITFAQTYRCNIEVPGSTYHYPVYVEANSEGEAAAKARNQIPPGHRVRNCHIR